MLAIRLQRTGRSGHAQFRLIVQDSHLNPSSGKVVAQIGNYNPHTKAIIVDKDKAGFYLKHGAQPSERVVGLLKKEGVKLPKWVDAPSKKEGKIRNPEKLRRNQPAKPAEPKTETAAEAADIESAEEPTTEQPKASEETVATDPPLEKTAA